MKLLRPVGGWILRAALLIPLMAWLTAAHAQSGDEIRVVSTNGVVEVSTDGGTTWARAKQNQPLKPGDHVRTGQNTHTLLAGSGATFSYPELSQVKILPPTGPGTGPGLHILRGLFSGFFRGKPGRLPTASRAGVAGVKGTEFVMAVDAQERTTLYVIEGEVEFTNAHGALTLTSGQFAVLEEGTVPVRAAGPVQTNLVQWANNLLQWAFYYPAVLDPRDLPLTADETQALGDSLTAYQAGDLPGALSAYGARLPASEAERIYRAALLLSVGKSEESSAVLSQLEQANASERGGRLAAALRLQIATVKREPVMPPNEPELTAELLAASYFEQSRAGGDATLQRALDLARRAASNAPQFGFAWVRVAELEFSFGRTSQALDALEKGLTLSPRNAQGLALKGFLLAAQYQTRPAIEWFDRAIATDPSLANAWLGRGLCRIRRGDLEGGREDLLLAASLEPRRAQLRSYLGKAFGDAGDKARAIHELKLAKELDSADPTAWFYSALIKADHNQLNEAISDLKKSQELNENRSVFRTSLLLDQDRAVRSANLAQIHADNGMIEVSLREAGRAVSDDYANYSTHLFLANSYDQLRDPNRINLRYETPAESEYLIANLLAPVGAGLLAQSVSQQEYSKLFERDRFGVSSTTEYLSRGAWKEHGAQFGTFGKSSYLFEALYRTDNGQRPNNDIEEREFRLHLKHELTPSDTLYFRITDYKIEGGDLIQYYDQNRANRDLRTDERQQPNLAAGYHHKWDSDAHTLFLFGRLVDEYVVNNPAQATFLVSRVDQTNASIEYAEAMTAHQRYRSELEIYSVELQHLWQWSRQHFTVGARYQWGDLETRNLQTDPSFDVQVFFPQGAPAASQRFRTDFDRVSVYGYDLWKVTPSLGLVGGVSYDRISFPENFRAAPIENGEETRDQVSPKAGLIWTPTKTTTARAAYTRSLSGVSVDQSFQIEPSQVAGFNQSFRSIVPESVAGANAGARFETYNASLEQNFSTGTYLGLSAEVLKSRISRTVGTFNIDPAAFAEPGGMREHIDYESSTLGFSVDQLLGDGWALGVRYHLSFVDLEDRFPEMLDGAILRDGVRRRQHLEATLNELTCHAIYNHSSGVFAKAEAVWTLQRNRGYQFRTPPDPNDPEDPGNSAPDLPGDETWHFNAYIGYRFPGRKAELTLGLLNITDQDYRLNPLNYYNERARERTFLARFHFTF